MRVERSFSPLNWGLEAGMHFAMTQFSNFPGIEVRCMTHNPHWRDTIKIFGEISDSEAEEFNQKLEMLEKICAQVI